ncbi:MAG: TspO/MBR family protein [Ignavibacteria bacterium]|jgi:tryptophan-rich sensory protein
MVEVIKLVISIVLCQLAGFIGSIYTRDSVETWYKVLNKPSFNPPNWLFGPVWITLYVLMGISAYFVWKEGFQIREVKYALSIFLIQLVFNSLWSIVFFGSRSITGGLIVIIILWVLILVTILSFYKISAISAYLLIPYLLWVTFASVLNFTIWQLN